MRYIFTESEKVQSILSVQAVYDIDTMVLYSFNPNELRLIIERVAKKEHNYTKFYNSQAISFWQQLAKQVDGRCTIKDARERMEAFVESVSND